jgi:hypothetical protein
MMAGKEGVHKVHQQERSLTYLYEAIISEYEDF